MKHVLARAGRGVAVLLGALGVGWGCTDEETGLFVQGNIALDAPQCGARAEASAPLRMAGTLDVAIKLDYQATLLVGSQLTPRGDKENLRAESMITAITGAEVQLFTDTGALDTEFTVPASGVIFPDASSDPGFGTVNATLIPAATGIELANEITTRADVRTRVAQVKVFGKTIGGLEVESGELTYVIRVCEGCLVDFPSAVMDSAGNCSENLDMNPEAPCRLGQDDPVDCRLCRGSNAFCQNIADIAQ